MADDIEFLTLPDLVLDHIFSYIDCPFTLLNLGSTCKKLYLMTSTSKYWWRIATNWLHGMWYCLDEVPDKGNSRDWFLEFLHTICINKTDTKKRCRFETGEIWTRMESQVFRCYLGMLQLAYVDRFRGTKVSSGIDYREWIYDIGLYKREYPVTRFDRNCTLNIDDVYELSSLGQGRERDLRARRLHCTVDPAYYVHVIGTSHENWIDEFFSRDPFGSKYPLLVCPFQNAVSTASEISGFTGFLMCLTAVIETYVIKEKKMCTMSLVECSRLIRSAVEGFANSIICIYPDMRYMWGENCFTSAIQSMVAEESFIDLTQWQNYLDSIGLKLQGIELIRDVKRLVQKHGGIDSFVNSIRSRWRCSLFSEIEHVLFADGLEPKKVTRINLTNSDLIGGDNSRQLMSSAAFVTEVGSLVVWHLIKRLHF